MESLFCQGSGSTQMHQICLVHLGAHIQAHAPQSRVSHISLRFPERQKKFSQPDSAFPSAFPFFLPRPLLVL